MSAKELPGWKPAEIELSRILLRDTVNRSTFFLQKGYMFGLKPFDFNRWHVMKLPGRVFLLADGTLRVYELKAGEKGTVIERIDREEFSGSNFNMMTFIRHDTLWQYGGYGFWKSRSIFLWFDISTGKWKPLEKAEPLTGHLTLHHYDPVADCFYMMGSYETLPQENHRTIFRDTVFRFSFRTRRWEALGAFHPGLKQRDIILHPDLNIIYHERGCFVYQEHPFSQFDFVRNEVRPMSAALEDSIGQSTSYLKRYENTWLTSFSLGDSMHMIMGTDTSVRLFVFFFQPDAFSGKSIHPVFIQRSFLMDMKDMWMQLAGYFFIPVFALLTLLWFLRHRFMAFVRSWGLHGRTETDLDVDASLSDTQIYRFCAAQDPSVFSETFTAFFKQLKEDQQLVFGLMLSEARAGRLVTAAHISEVMGLQRRTAHLQKVMRNKAIMGINQAFKRSFRTEITLIERQKSELDKRSNLFRITPGIWTLLLRNEVADSK